jgi:hypothetical protein
LKITFNWYLYNTEKRCVLSMIRSPAIHIRILSLHLHTICYYNEQDFKISIWKVQFLKIIANLIRAIRRNYHCYNAFVEHTKKTQSIIIRSNIMLKITNYIIWYDYWILSIKSDWWLVNQIHFSYSHLKSIITKKNDNYNYCSIKVTFDFVYM